MKDPSGKLILFPELVGVDQVSVMCQGEISLDMADDQRLDVSQILAAGGGVTYMAESHVSSANGLKPAGGKYIRYQSVSFVMGEYSVIIDGDPAGLLTSVLQCIESQIDRLSSFTGPFFKNTEHTAFFVYRVEH